MECLLLVDIQTQVQAPPTGNLPKVQERLQTGLRVEVDLFREAEASDTD